MTLKFAPVEVVGEAGGSAIFYRTDEAKQFQKSRAANLMYGRVVELL